MAQGKLIKNLFFAVATVATLVGAVSVKTPALAADYTMKIGLATFKDQQHKWAEMYKEAVEKRSNGRIEVKIFPRSQLGPIPRQIEGLQLGTIEAFVSPADFYVGVDPRFGVFSIPVLFKDKAHSAKVLLDPELNKDILELGKGKGMVGVSVFPHSIAHYFAKEPIRRLADFKGKKLRVNATAAEREKMRRLGASAVPMPLSEVMPSLQRGVIDGTMSGMVIYVVFKFHTLGKIVTRTNDTMIISVAHLSKAWLDKLPADLREIVVEEGLKLQPRIRDFSMEQGERYNEAWSKLGGELHTLPAEDLVKIRNLLKTVGDEVTKSNPEVSAFYRKVLAIAEKY